MSGQKVREAVQARSHWRCEAQVKCEGARPAVFHHRKRAGRVDSVENLMHICTACHIWIHDNPSKSYSLGWLVHSWSDPEQIPVLRVGQAALPTEALTS